MLLSNLSMAEVNLPLRSQTLLPGPVQSEIPLRNTNVHVVVANYKAIREDFEFLRYSTREIIDERLCNNALISKAQAD